MYAEKKSPNTAMYSTTNSTYGTRWQNSFAGSFAPSAAQGDRTTAAAAATTLVHGPGMTTLSNVPLSVKGNFTNVRTDLQTDRQGLWANSVFNTPGATVERGVGTYSNLQGAWGRIGPSTYDASHAGGEWAKRWSVRTFEPAPLRTLYDHRNVDPRDNWVPVEPYPPNMPY